MATTDGTLSTDAQTVLDQLHELEHVSHPLPPGTAETARQLREALHAKREFLESRAHTVAFIGSVGVGKSSFIGVTANLLIGPPPTDRRSLKESSILAIGSGRTTVCEVRIQASPPAEPGKVGLRIEPLSPDEMKTEIEIFAQDEWSRRQPDTRRGGEDDSDPTSQEVHRAIRAMVGYAEYQETITEGGLKRRRNVRPLDDVIPRFDTPAALAAHLLERANLPARTRTEWSWDAATPENLKELKKVFADVNQGSEPDAMLPRTMFVVVPEPLPGSSTTLDLTLIDTRGLDGTVESRGDLQELLRDQRAVIVLCASFKDAPGDTLRALLRSMAGNALLRQAIPRTLVVLLDQGDAEQVNGARGERDSGQELKIDECHIALEGAGLAGLLDRTQLLAFDALKDDRGRVLDAISDRLAGLRRSREDELREQIEDARSFLANKGDELLPVLRERVDRKLRETLALHPLTDAPLRDPLEGMYLAIRDGRYASVVYATCRRNGGYSRLDLYAAVEAHASDAASEWLIGLVEAARKKLDELETDTEYERVRDYIRLRSGQFSRGWLVVVSDYATRVGEQVKALLQDDPVWQACCDEWGAGAGFKQRVTDHLEAWSRRQQGLTAHERTDVTTEIPLLGEVARPVQAPRFTLHVRNLRALRQVSWSPEPVSVLIGANGAGKTTLLLALKLLGVAYARGLPEAVTQVLGGSGNLKSWGAAEDEPVEIGLDIGDARWRIQLVPRAGSVDYLTSERLLDGDREVFSRDSLGGFVHEGKRLDVVPPQTGLWFLTFTGAYEPALRRVAKFVEGIAVHHDPDLWTLREQGSRTTDDGELHTRGANALTLLRRWHQDRAGRPRYQFVVDGLRAAFPGTVSDLDFMEAGTTIVARVYRPGVEAPSPLRSEANGVLQLLVLYCEVASAEDGSVLAIDEPENSLHPYAVRSFLRRTSKWARQHHLTVLLATHSTVLLDELTGHPEQVYVMKAQAPGEPVPARLDELCDRAWLANFKLGDLYEQGEIGSNEDEA